MLFSSLVFLFCFLPAILLLYYLVPKQLRNSILFLGSLVFFAWGGVSYSLILIFSILLNYLVGLLISKTQVPRLILGVGVAINLSLLIVFKYANFIIANINEVISIFKIPLINNPTILLPIGISFYTFQAISYLIDIYRGTCSVQRNVVKLGLYISLFPQLIAGPIVRYYDIQKQISKRQHTLDKFRSGLIRFVIGFGKKMIIANTMAAIADEIFAYQPDQLGMLYSWIGILAYSLQIYYDFSGYSDMAIGLARMFGFELLENFNFPYIAKSIKEFWRRWHISLSNWFRDYLYIPLGGNRKGGKRTIVNLLIVFFVTGFWHGASWNFLVWGLMHGFFLVLERGKFGDYLNRSNILLKSSYTLLIVIFAWVLFRAETLSYGVNYWGAMLGLFENTLGKFLLFKLLNLESVLVFVIGVAGAFGIIQKLYSSFKNLKLTQEFQLSKAYSIVKELSIVGFVLFVLYYGIGNLVLGAYNPFIYFRF